MADKTSGSIRTILVILTIGVILVAAVPGHAGAQVPLTTLSLIGTPGNGGWFRSDVKVSFVATDYSGSGINHTEYSFDGSPNSWTRYTEPFNVTREGMTSIYYRSVDNVSDEETTKRGQVNIDKTPPTLSYTLSPAPNAKGWSNQTVHLYFEYSDNVSEIAEYPHDETLTNEGTYESLSGTATDNAGNVASVTVPTFSIDRTPPVIGSLTMQSNLVSGNYFPVSASVVEANPDRIEWDWGDGTGSQATVSYGVARGSHAYTYGGTYKITLTVIDLAGNVVRSSADVIVSGPAPTVPATPTPTPTPATPTPTPVPLPSSTPKPTPAAGLMLTLTAMALAGIALVMWNNRKRSQ